MSERPLWYRWARVWFVGISIVSSGVLLYKYATPTDEQLIAQFSPEVRQQYERNKELRRQEQLEVMRNAQLTSASTDPIWKTGNIKSPWGKENKGANPNLIDPVKFHQQKAEEFKREQVQKAEHDLNETERLVQASKDKKWYKFW